MIGDEGLGRPGVDLREGVELVGEHLDHQAGIQFGIIHMPGFQASVPVMLDQVVVGVPRESERVEPERVDRRFYELCQPRSQGSQMRQVVLEDVMPDWMREPAQRTFQPVEPILELTLQAPDRGCPTGRHGGEGEDLGRPGIDLQIDRQASIEDRAMPLEDCGRGGQLVH